MFAQRGDDGKVNSVRIEIWKAICREEGAVEGKGAYAITKEKR